MSSWSTSSGTIDYDWIFADLEPVIIEGPNGEKYCQLVPKKRNPVKEIKLSQIEIEI